MGQLLTSTLDDNFKTSATLWVDGFGHPQHEIVIKKKGTEFPRLLIQHNPTECVLTSFGNGMLIHEEGEDGNFRFEQLDGYFDSHQELCEYGYQILQKLYV